MVRDTFDKLRATSSNNLQRLRNTVQRFNLAPINISNYQEKLQMQKHI